MAVFKKGKKWFHDWRDRAGKRHRKGHTNRSQAERADRELKRWKRHEGPRPRGLTVAALILKFLATKAGICKEALQNLTKQLTDCAAAIGHRRPDQIDAADFAGYRAKVRSYKPNTRRNCDTAVRSFLKWCYRTGQLPTAPDELYPPGKSRPELRQVIADQETADRIEQTAHGPALLLYMLGRYAGMRLTEALRAEAGDYNATNHTITIRSVKNNSDRSVPCNPILDTYLRALTADQPRNTRLTALANPNGHALNRAELGRQWRAYRASIDAHQLHPHDLRRTFASDTAPHCSIATLMQLCGWRSVKSAVPYIVPQAAHRVDAIAKAWAHNPRALDTLSADEPQPG